MASTYTVNTGIELIANGEQSGTWGTTTNTNLQIVDRLTSGVGSITLSGITHTLATSDGALSDGQYKVLVFGGSPSGTNTVTVSPNDQSKQYFIVNNSGETIIISQGSGTTVTVANGSTGIIYCDGGGSGANVVNLTADLSGVLTSANNLSDLASAAIALTNLGLTATAAELNILDGVTATTSELNYNDITTLGTSQASKVVTADANGDVLFSEELKAKSYNDTFVSVSSSSNATTVNCETGNVFATTLSENTTFTFSSPPASGTAYGFALKVTQDASASGFTVTWPAAVDWPRSVTPILSSGASDVDQLFFYTTDSGSTWYGFVAGTNIG